jgi:4-hydroxythreonine-4-phosphate dehydrogenase
VFHKLRQLDSCLKKDFVIRKPCIAVLALNPHTGENGHCGNEEQNIILPAIKKARANGIMALGPYSPETLFSDSSFEKFDAILAMYHEQGMLPFKAFERHGGVVFMADLPVVCTTTVHGMAFDITGQGKADESGMRNAFYLAMDIFRNRQMQAEVSANPLKHYDISTNGNEGDLNVEQIAGVEREED